ncbi:MAG: MBL fold metallo-hydrolase, partial [Melioribacter sp.]|nr:MBL fold metallo-hydrolase [Melioribacter sp.]
MIKVQKFIFNPFLENTYIVWDNNSKETIVIDPGCSNKNEQKLLAHFIENNNLVPKFIINTHCHIDHILGNLFVKKNYNPLLLMPEKDIFLLDIMKEQSNYFGIKFNQSPLPDEFISEDKILKFGNCDVKFLFTPGHSPGEFCVYLESEKICFTGDVLFKGSIGRTDLWGGDYE